MAILVSLFAGDAEAIRRHLGSGGWTSEVGEPDCAGEVGFKFGIPPEDAFDALIDAAAGLVNVPPFRFNDCVSGQLEEGGESFQGTLNGRFAGLFSEFPENRIEELSTRWTARLVKLYDTAFPPTERRKRTLPDRLGSGLTAAICAIVIFPILAIAHLSPSFRRDKARNREKLAGRRPPAPPTNQELISSLVRVCKIARDRHDVVIYTWHL